MERLSKKYGGKSQVFLRQTKGIRLAATSPSDPEFAHFFVSHYPGSKGVMGRRFLYKIYENDQFVGIIGGASAPGGKIMKVFRDFFGTSDNQSFLNNNIYRLVQHRKNLGTRVLKAFRTRVFLDYLEKYHQPLIGIITFVEPPRTGAIYKADNWTHLGLTQGKRCTRRKEQDNKRTFTEGVKKHIYAVKYTRKTFNRHKDIISRYQKIKPRVQQTLDLDLGGKR